MPEKTKYFLDTRVLTLFGVLAVVPLIVGAYFIVGSARVGLTNSIGRNFGWLSEHTASSLDQALSREVFHLVELASSPDLIRRASEMNQAGRGVTPDVLTLDTRWKEVDEKHPVVRRLMDNEASVHLARIVATTPLYQELMLLDASGVVIAASGMPRRYFFGKRPWFQKAMAGEEGWLSIQLQRDPETNADVVSMSWPVRVGDRSIGVLRSVLDAATLLAPLTAFRFGETGHALLFHQKDGEVLAGPAAMPTLQRRYAGLEDFRRAMSENRRFFITEHPTTGEPGLAGYAQPQLAASYAQLDWVVVVQQSVAEAHAPLADLTTKLIGFFLGIGLAVLALALYLSFKLEKPVTDVEVDLHHAALRP